MFLSTLYDNKLTMLAGGVVQPGKNKSTNSELGFPKHSLIITVLVILMHKYKTDHGI